VLTSLRSNVGVSSLFHRISVPTTRLGIETRGRTSDESPSRITTSTSARDLISARSASLSAGSILSCT